MFPTMNDELRDNERSGSRREVYLTDGNTAILESRDPYGMWHIFWKNGKTPLEVKEQMFTSADQAHKYLEIWLGKNKYDTKISETPVEIPELKTKKVA